MNNNMTANILSKENIQDIYHATPLQAGMYFHYQLDPDSLANFNQFCYSIKGNINLDFIKRSFEELINRYDILRTIFIQKDSKQLLQVVLKQVIPDYQYLDISNQVDKPKAINKIKTSDKEKGFNLNKEILMRLCIVKMANDEFEFIWSNHHIQMDGWSRKLVIEEFFKIYSEFVKNGKFLSNKPRQFKIYIDWLKKRKNEFPSDQYWKNYLSDYEYNSIYPQNNKTYGFKDKDPNARFTFRVTENHYNLLKKLVSTYDVTLNIILKTIWGIILSKLNNTQDVVFGSVVSGRPKEIYDIENMIGLFINTIPIRIQYQSDTNITDLFKEVQKSEMESEKFHYSSLAEIQSYTSLKNELINHIVVFENHPGLEGSEIKDNDRNNKPLEIKASGGYADNTDYNLNIIIIPFPKDLIIRISYNENIYSDESVKLIEQYFSIILDKLSRDNNFSLSELQILTDKEKREILEFSNGDKRDYDLNKTIQQLLEEQVLKKPMSVALVYGDEKITYNELNKRSNKLANYLLANGVRQDSIVAVMQNRTIELIVSIFAILKTGGAYLGIDPNYPQERTKYMLNDSKTSHILINSDLMLDLSSSDSLFVKEHIIEIDKLENQLNKYPDNNLSIDYKSSDLLYLIYTSGSTGQPKGVMLDQINMVNLVFFDLNETNIDFSSVLQFCTISFDVSANEIFGCLLAGGKLLLVKKNTILDMGELFKEIKNNNIKTLFLPMAYLKNIFNKDIISQIPKCITHIQTAGEQVVISDEMRNYLQKNHIVLHNHYGPSETHVVTTLTILPEEDHPELPSIGKPISNTSIYILDKNKQLVPRGVNGEIYIGGAQVGRGYFGKEDITNKNFIANPFREGKMYRSGDLARWLPDGNIEFLGRADHQVKIRGFRIEPGEIEIELMKIESIQEAIVTVLINDSNENFLCAYIVFESDENNRQGLNYNDIRTVLADRLPDYMIPSAFVKLESFPLTPSGKIDRKRLPKPEQVIVDSYITPRNKIEEELVSIWSEILNIDKDKISINSNFFELGGHSLTTSILISTVYKRLNVKISISEIFKLQTVTKIAELITKSKRNDYYSFEVSKIKSSYEASSQQKRIFFIQQMDFKSTAYNMFEFYVFDEKLDIKKLQLAFNKLINRHEILRTAFIEKEDIIHQEIKNCNLEIEKFYLDSDSVAECLKEFVRPFDLSASPLIRIGLIIIKQSKYILMVDMHHIITDAISHDILRREFLQLYEGIELEPLKYQYKDYSEWQLRNRDSEFLQLQKEYWMKEFEGELPSLEMPLDFINKMNQGNVGSTFNFKIEKDIYKKIQNYVANTRITLNTILLSSYYLFLSKICNQSDIVIGIPTAIRPHDDLAGCIGMFANTLAIRSNIDSEVTLDEFVQNINPKLSNALTNQDYQFEDLVDSLKIERIFGKNPLFETMFAFHRSDNFQTDSDEELNIVNSDYNYENKNLRFDLTLSAYESGQLYFNFQYNTALHKVDTIKRFAEYYKNILKTLCNEPLKKVKELDIISKKERQLILDDFNATNNLKVEKTIQELFEQEVQSNMDNISLIWEDQYFSYGFLSELADNITSELEKQGVEKNEIIGVITDDPVKTVVFIMGILKRGACFLIIDSDSPKTRINRLINDTGIRTVLLNKPEKEIIVKNQLVLSGDKLRNKEKIISNNYSINDSAYVIFTSGSTGIPKGTIIKQAGVVNTILYRMSEYKLGKYDYSLQLFNSSFDGYITSLFTPLLSGNPIVLTRRKELSDIGFIINLIDRYQISNFIVVPQLLDAIMYNSKDDNCKSLKKITLAGDKITEKLIEKVQNQIPNLKIYNEYGLSESSVLSTINIDVSNGSHRNIGKPISNTNIYILNNDSQLQGIGIPGELTISGIGNTIGYLNRPELTSNSFTTNKNLSEKRFFKTGDIAKWNEKGDIEIIGRNDEQVKVRGLRIELGEIENVINKHKDIKESIVNVFEKGGENYVCAYIIFEKKQDTEELRAYLKNLLPDYMIPSYFIELDKLPLTSTGKVNRKAFPLPELKAGTEYEAPTTTTEKILVNIWSEVLNIPVEEISVTANFFSIGGHSLKIAVLIRKIQEETGVEFPFQELYLLANIKAQASKIDTIKWLSNNQENDDEPERFEVSI
jgi:tyrocidine synthetase II